TSARHDADSRGVDVKGKAVLILRFVPWGEKGAFGGRRSPHSTLVSKLRNARDHGAAGAILVTPPAAIADAAGEADLHGVVQRASPRGPTLPALLATPEAAGRLLGKRGKDLQALAREIEESKAPRSVALEGLRVRFDTTAGYRVLRNVVGRVR